MKYVEINLQMQDLYTKNYKTLLRKIKELKGRKVFHVDGRQYSKLAIFPHRSTTRLLQKLTS